MLKLIDRYIIVEWLMALSVGTLLIAGIFVGTEEYKQVMSLICDSGVSPNTAITITALELPGIVVFTLPAGVMIATLFALFRQGRDSEITALQCAGVSTLRIMRPYLVVAFAACLFSYALTEYVVPQARRTASRMLVIAAVNCELPRTRNSLTIMQASDAKKGAVDRIVLVGRYLKKELQNVFVFDFTNPKLIQLIWSQAGTWHRGQWNLLNGHIYSLGSQGVDNQTSHFQKMIIDGINKAVRKFEGVGPLPDEVPTSELARRIEAKRAAGKEPTSQELSTYLRRYSQPAACVLVAFAAFPLALMRRRSKRSSIGFAYGGMLLLAYFLVHTFTLELGYAGRMDPYLAAWLPGGLLALVGVILFGIRSTFK